MSPSLQNLSKSARKVACENLGVEIDICNAHPTLLKNFLAEKQVIDEYKMIKLYAENYEKWRKFVEVYYQETTKEAKKIITRIFYGGKPPTDIPFLWKLRSEVNKVVDFIMNQEGNQSLLSFFN